MDTAELIKISEKCRALSEEIEDGKLQSIVQCINDAIRSIQRSFSGSWIGYHANVYYFNFDPPAPGDHFSAEWGFQDAFSNPTSQKWREVTQEQVEEEISRITGGVDIKPLEIRSKEIVKEFKSCQRQLVGILTSALDSTGSEQIEELRDKAKELKSFFSADEVIKAQMPSGSYWTRDSLAMSQGIHIPPHVQVYAKCASLGTAFFQIGELATVSETASNLARQKAANNKHGLLADGTVFIGHGRSQDWRQLGSFLQDRLNLKWDEFNRGSTAGVTIKERLENMLSQANFAFLIMTAEDEHTDNTIHARENVIHEIGLFQGRLGFNRAIVLLEEGCQEFSNIHGIGQIRYPRGYIKATFEEVRGVLEREGVLSKS